MATKKATPKKIGRPSKGDRPSVLIRFDPQIFKALGAYLAITKEDRNAFIQRLVMEHLMSKGFYPPKP